MAMMGRHSVDYHAKTLGIAAPSDQAGPGLDAEASAALSYYSSHGETPLAWGGSGAEALGLSGRVRSEQYYAVYAEGGALDPTTGERLVRTQRPGMEIVVSAQKSLAELGVIGRAEDMHAILEAETTATLGYLDWVTRQVGGRRGRARESCPTAGMIYVRTRHASSRAGDPSPHDHILVANVVAMADDPGGFKAPDTTAWRDHLHAATMIGRTASAAKAIELGYGIESDPGPSGRLGHWRIAGIPRTVEEVHSKRAAEISDALAERGFVSWRAKEVAAKETRPAKRHEPIADLMARWQTELEDAGHPVAVVSQMVDEARLARTTPSLSRDEVRCLIETALGPEGSLGRRKVFSRPEVIVALAPALYGQDPDVLEAAVNRLLADPEVIPLIGVPGARQAVFTTATTLATEAAIAEGIAAQMDRVDGPRVSPPTVARALDEAEARLGRALTAGQRRLVEAATGSGRGAELVVGVAGAGKTTALEVTSRAFEAEGYIVLGTATSGQAARTLGREAGIESRTLASINWRLAHGQLPLTNRHVVILDEVGATDDRALLGLLSSAERAGAKVVMVGDWRQLGPVGPGGAFEALLRRHKGAVAVLEENVRQRNRAEAEILLDLRSGSVTRAVDWYGAQGRIRTGATRTEAIEAAVAAWVEDMSQGRDSLLLAWRRTDVAALNARARVAMAEAGRLSGPELVVAGQAFQAGDRVVALSPAAQGQIVTSQRGVVTAVDRPAATLSLAPDDGKSITLTGEDLGRLTHGYATTVHRSQGATADTAHLLADGGGRELAYVAMSRARDASHVYVVADDLGQAKEDLVREWTALRRPRWAVDLGVPGADGETPETGPRRLALRQARLAAQVEAIHKGFPAADGVRVTEVTRQLRALESQRADLLAGQGPYRDAVGPALAQLRADEAALRRAERDLASRPGLLERRRLARALPALHAAVETSRKIYETAVGPERRRIEDRIGEANSELLVLRARSASERLWLSSHPEAARRLGRLVDQLGEVRRQIEDRRRMLEGIEPIEAGRRIPVLEPQDGRSRHLGRGPELGPEAPSRRRGVGISLW